MNGKETGIGNNLGEDINKLSKRRNMMDVNLFLNNFFPNEIEINLNMFSVSMECTKVVTLDDWSCGGIDAEFSMKRV